MMLPEPPDHDTNQLASAANEVVRAIDGLRDEVASQKKYGRRNRALIWIVAASVVLDMILSVGLLILFNKAHHAAELAKKSTSSQVIACEAGNETRRIQTDLWNTILAFPPPPGELPAAAQIREQRTVEFRTYIDQAFAQQDCDKLVRG